MVLRCTRKVLELLNGGAVTLTEAPPTEDHWYLIVLWFDRKKCLLLTHAGTLFSVFLAGIRKPDLRPIGPPCGERCRAGASLGGLAAEQSGPTGP